MSRSITRADWTLSTDWYLLVHYLLKLPKNNFKATEPVNSHKLENRLVDILKASQKNWKIYGNTIATSDWTLERGKRD